jgi:hypothetical protein
MGSREEPLTLSPDDVEKLNKQLGEMRHNVNNKLALMVASIELIKLVPHRSVELCDKLMSQPDFINQEISAFSNNLRTALKIDLDD